MQLPSSPLKSMENNTRPFVKSLKSAFLKRLKRLSGFKRKTKSESTPFQELRHDHAVGLPFEIIDTILGYGYSQKDLSTLRLVSRTFNEAITPRMFGELTLPPISYIGQWKVLPESKGGGSPAWTNSHTLRVFGLEQDWKEGPRSPWIRTPYRRHLTVAQEKYLCEDLKKLKAVKTVHWKIPPRLNLNVLILQAIKELPLLEDVHFAIDDTCDQRDRYLWQLCLAPDFPSHNLKVLSLDIYPRSELDPVDSISADIRSLLQQCNALEDLSIVGPVCDHRPKMDFEDLLSTASCDIDSRPLVATLHLSRFKVTLSPRVVSYIMNLSSLSIFNDQPEDVSLWSALSSSGILLRTVKVAVLTDALLCYLKTYRGLNSFHGSIREQRDHNHINTSLDEDTRKALDQLFESVLPQHAQTLETFVVRPAGMVVDNRLDARRWCISKAQIAALRRLSNLKRVEVGFLHHWNGDPMDISWNDTIPFLWDLSAVKSVEVHIHPFTMGEWYYRLHYAIERFLEQASLSESPARLLPSGTHISSTTISMYGQRYRAFHDEPRSVYWVDLGDWESIRDAATRIMREDGERRGVYLEV